MDRAIVKLNALVLLAVLVVAIAAISIYIAYGLPRATQRTAPMQTSIPTSTTTPSQTPTPAAPTAMPNQTLPATPTTTATATPSPIPLSTPTLSPTPTPKQTPTNTIIVVSVDLLKPYTPGGPTIQITLQNNGTSPVTSLQATITFPPYNYTYSFTEVNASNPLLPGQSTSQTKTLINAGFEGDQTYPIEIISTQQDGKQINYTTQVTIATSTTTTATGGNNELQLTVTLQNTVFKLGDPINLTVSMTNISGQTLNYTDTGLNFDFKVYNDTNNLAYRWSNFIAIPQFIAIIPFAAGANMSQNFTWGQTCNFNISVQGELVSPGSYYVVGLTGPSYGFETTPIEITIVQP